MSNGTSFSFSYGPRTIAPGGQVILEASPPEDDKKYSYSWKVDSGKLDHSDRPLARWTVPEVPSLYKARVTVTHREGKQTVTDIVDRELEVEVTPGAVPEALLRSVDEGIRALGQPAQVSLASATVEPTADQPLWIAIRNRTRAISYDRYEKFIARVLCEQEREPTRDEPEKKRALRQSLSDAAKTPRAFRGVDAYQLLKTATEIFLLLECGVAIENGELYSADEEKGRLKNWSDDELGVDKVKASLAQYLGEGKLPCINRIVDTVFSGEATVDSPFCLGVLNSALECPCLLELIWSYWHEEGMLVQSIKHVAVRFQNRRTGGRRDPLAQMEIDPLRPMSNLLWGYVQDEASRLTVVRRAYEYDHHYGISLLGKAVPALRSADSRSKFLEAFHTLLHRTWSFYREDADTTVTADAFPLLNGLKEVHLLLAEGAHNQFNDLPWTARVEMLIQQWLLARPEIRDFLRGRSMVPYKEGWMSQVDAMKKLQSWTDVGVTHFRDLGVYGEQILLSIRYGDWIADTSTETNAKNWAHYWRPEIQGYIHAYRAATGIDLTSDKVDATMPALHLKKRLPQAAQAR